MFIASVKAITKPKMEFTGLQIAMYYLSLFRSF